MRIKPLFTGILIAGFVLASQWSQQFFHLLNGSLSYAPALLILGSLGIYHYQQQKQEPLILLAATGVLLWLCFSVPWTKQSVLSFPWELIFSGIC